MKRERNKEIAAKFRGLPCEVCRTTYGTVADHIKSFGAGGECIKENLWPLCQMHHIEKHSYGLTSFATKYPRLKVSLANKGWRLDEFTDKWLRLTPQGWEKQ